MDIRATLVGITFEVLLTSPILLNFSDFLRLGVSAFATTALYSMSILLILFPLFYPAIVSYFIKPKRIVSPLHITMGTWAVDTVVSLVAAVGIASNLNPNSIPPPVFPNATTVYSDTEGIIFIFFMAAFFIGLYEIFGARLLIGVDIEGMKRETFSILVPAEEVARIIQSDTFFSKRKRTLELEPEYLVVKWKDRDNDTVIMALTRDSRAPQARTILATVAYNEGSFYISEDEDATSQRNSMKNDLEKRLQENYPLARFELEPKPEPDKMDIASARAYAIAKGPSQSKLAVGRLLWSDLSNYLKVAVGITVLGLAFTPIGYYYEVGNFDYGSIAAVFLVALLAELGLAVKDEISRRRGLSETWPPKESQSFAK